MSPTYLRRLERKSPPEVVAADREGKLSVRSVRYFVRLSRPKQLAELRRRQNALAQHAERCRQLSESINGYLDTDTQVDLERLRQILVAAEDLNVGGSLCSSGTNRLVRGGH